MKQLSGRVAIVTGAGSGIGRATSLLLAQSGCRVAIADVHRAGLDETALQLRAAGAEVSVHELDVSDRVRMQRLPEQVLAAHGAAHILVNNAGVGVNGKFTDQSLEDFEWLMGINFWGVVYGCKFFLPHLMAAEQAHIVNISSVFGLAGVPKQSSYCASKFAVRGFTESLRAELKDTRVGVTLVHPGGIATNIAAASRVIGDEDLHRRHAQAVAMFRKLMPPETAAQRIVNAIRADRTRVLITRETHIMDIARRLSPTASDALIDWSFKRFS